MVHESIISYVYILKSEKNGNFYVGITDYFEQRIKQHSTGQVRTTKRLLPVRLVSKGKVLNINAAKKIEKKIKQFKKRLYPKDY